MTTQSEENRNKVDLLLEEFGGNWEIFVDGPALYDEIKRLRESATITIYDVSVDKHIPATQADIDELENYVHSFSTHPSQDKIEPEGTLNFKLACYVNRQRDDGLFIAEDKPIEPYAGITNVDGSLCYPSVPQTRYRLPMQLPVDFAREIVKRWNAYGNT